MRQAILVVVLVAASFLGGAFVNGPGLTGPRPGASIPRSEQRGRDRLGRPQGNGEPRRRLSGSASTTSESDGWSATGARCAVVLSVAA